MKKAQGLSMNVVIIAALAIIVLIIVVFMFVRGAREGGTAFFDCRSRGGECVPKDSCKDDDGRVDITVTSCVEGQECCLFKEET